MPSRKKYHHGNLREALIDASLLAIAEHGVRALTLREIGNRAGVSRMAAYRHFIDKADLLFGISEAGFAKFADALETAKGEATGDFPARLTAMALAYVRFAGQHSAHYAVMFQEAGEHVRKGDQAARAFGVLEQTIREGQESGDVREGNSAHLAQLVWSTVHGLSTLKLAADLTATGPGATLITLGSDVLAAGLRPAVLAKTASLGQPGLRRTGKPKPSRPLPGC